MKAPNHVIGGYCITGILSSFCDVNIFADKWYLILIPIIALLPDIDHTKSLYGRLFRPISKMINRKYGHRTITHSLAVLLILTTLVAFVESIYRSDYDFSIIFFFAYFSHILLDLVTVNGCLFLYPLKNPCVLPGKREHRMRTGNVRSEFAAFIIFILIFFTTSDLMRNGFWNTYNRSFGTIKHLYSEFKKSDGLLNVNYQYKIGTKEFTGNGLCIESSENKAVLLNENFIELNNDEMIIENVEPTRTKQKFEFSEQIFNQISIDSFRTLITDKHLIELNFTASKEIQTVINSKASTTKTVNEKYINSIEIFEIKEAKQKIEKFRANSQIEILDTEIELRKQEVQFEIEIYNSKLAEIESLGIEYEKAEDYRKEQIISELKELKKLKRPRNRNNEIQLMNKRLSTLKKLDELKKRNAQPENDNLKLEFTGTFKTVEI
jgi:inner membrane protein